jgi:hypothetical protein
LLARTNTTDGIPAHEWIFIHLDELLEDLVDFFSPQAQAKELVSRRILQLEC